MADNKLVQSFGGCNRNFNKEKWISAWIQKLPWKIQYNEFGLEDEAESVAREIDIAGSRYNPDLGFAHPGSLERTGDIFL